VVANAVRRALEVAPPAPPDDEPWVNRKVLFASGIATAVGLVGALVCARHYDRIGPDGIGRVARAIAFLPVVFLGAWMRWTWRSAPLGFARLRSMVTTYLLVTAPCALAIYTMSLLLNGWTADAPMDALCSIESAEGSEARIACRTSSEMALRGEVRTGLLRARVPSARAFVAPVRRGGLGVWLIDVGGAREPRPVDVVPGGAESDWPSSPSRVLAPGVPFPGVSDDDPRPLRNGPGGR
jgi:hypothetical protein